MARTGGTPAIIGLVGSVLSADPDGAYTARGGSVLELPEDGSPERSLATEPDEVTALVTDAAAVYWTTASTVMMMAK